jgi:hypothetical protein
LVISITKMNLPAFKIEAIDPRRGAADCGQRGEAAGAGRALNLPDALLTWRELGPNWAVHPPTAAQPIEA